MTTIIYNFGFKIQKGYKIIILMENLSNNISSSRYALNKKTTRTFLHPENFTAEQGYIRNACAFEPIKTITNKPLNSGSVANSWSNIKQDINNNSSLRQRRAPSNPLKGFVGHPVNSDTLLHYNSKSIVYSFKKLNNIYPLLTKTENLLKSLFLSMFSLISRPVYLIKHDKIIIRLFVFLAPKADKYLDTSTCFAQTAPTSSNKKNNIMGFSPTIFLRGGKKGRSEFFATRLKQINNFLNIKKKRPQITDILNTQIMPVKNSISLNNLKDNVDKTMIHNHSLCAENNLERIKIIKGSGSLNPISPNNLEYPLAGQHQIGAAPQALTHACADKVAPSFMEPYPYISYSSKFKLNLEKLSVIFQKIFNKEVEFEIIKAQLPFQDSNILAQILGYNANIYKFRRMLKILIPRAVIKNPSKELSYIPTYRPHKQALVDSTSAKALAASLKIKVKDLNLFLAQPSSYLPPFFYSKYGINLSLPAPCLRSLRTAKPIVGEQIKFLDDTTGSAQANTSVNFLSPLHKPVKFSYLSGMNIKLAGRLMTQSIRPRFTVQSKQEGSLARVKVHYTEKSRFTGKNKRGAFSFTVSISHVLNASR